MVEKDKLKKLNLKINKYKGGEKMSISETLRELEEKARDVRKVIGELKEKYPEERKIFEDVLGYLAEIEEYARECRYADIMNNYTTIGTLLGGFFTKMGVYLNIEDVLKTTAALKFHQSDVEKILREYCKCSR